MEQDPAGKSPYSYQKGIDYVNQVVEDTTDLPPGVGILIDPSRLIGSAIEKKNPYYLPIGGLRIYGKNQEDVIKVASKVDPTKFKPNTTARFSLKGKEVRSALNEDPQAVKKNSFFTRATKSARSLGQRAVQGASALGKRAAQGASALGKGAAGAAAVAATSTRKIATDAAAAAKRAGTYVKNKATSLRSPKTRKGGLSNDEIAAKKNKGADIRTARAAAKTAQTNNVNLRGFPSNNSNLFANADAPAAAPAPAAARPGALTQKNYQNKRAKFQNGLKNKPVNVNSLFANDEPPSPAPPPGPPPPAYRVRGQALLQKYRGTRAIGTPPRGRANQQGQLGKAANTLAAQTAAQAASRVPTDY